MISYWTTEDQIDSWSTVFFQKYLRKLVLNCDLFIQVSIARDYVHFIFKLSSNPDFNFPLAKFQIWNTPYFYFVQGKVQNLEYSRF